MDDAKIKILILTANPPNTDQLGLGAELRAIKERLRLAEFRDEFEVEEESAVRLIDLQAHLLRHKPHVVHFSGHGSSDGQIILEGEDGHGNPVSPSALSRLFAVLKGNIRCVVLNACYSEAHASGIVESIDCVIGMTRTIEDASAMAFATSFYQALGYGTSIRTAFDLGCNQIELEREGRGHRALLPMGPARDFDLTRQSPHTVDVPKLIHARGVDPSKICLSACSVNHPRGPEGSSPAAKLQGDSGERARSSTESRASSSALVQAALHKLESGDDEAAILFGTQVLASDPDSVEAHYVTGLARVLQGDLQAAKAAFEKALVLNADHLPSLFGAAITTLETSRSAMETAERAKAEHLLRHLMEVESPHQHAHRAARRLLDEVPDYQPTVRESDPSEIRKRARRAVYLRIREGHQSGGMRIRSWLEALPPWSIIARLPVPAEIGSLVFAAVPYTLVLACNIPAWSLLFFLKFGMIAVINFLGYWHAFVVSRMLSYHLGKLRTKTHAPGDRFEMWCLEKVASFWGSINLRYPLRSTQDLVKLPPIDAPFQLAAARARAAFSEFLARLGRDRQIVSTYIVLFVLLTPINIWCAADHLSANSAAVSRYMMYVLEGYSALWSFHLVCALLILAPGIIREFLEADIGTAPSLSVAPLGHLYLGLGLLATYSYGITLVQHYLWQTHVTARHAAITLNVVCAVFTLVALLAPQIFITLALCEVKDRRLAKFSGPTDDPDVLKEQERARLLLKKTLSIWWFDVRSFLGLAILTFATIIMVSVYLYYVVNHIWVFA